VWQGMFVLENTTEKIGQKTEVQATIKIPEEQQSNQEHPRDGAVTEAP
jgi:hypothetical protein